MPELPEVETIARQLNKVLVNKVIGDVEVLRERSAQSDLGGLVGMEVTRVWRRGKYILIELQATGYKPQVTSYRRQAKRHDDQTARNEIQGTINGKREGLCLMIHLKMTGQLVWREAKPKLKAQSSKLRTIGSADADGLDAKTNVVGGHPTADWVGKLPSKHTRIVITFIDGSRLFFNDQRVFGWMKAATSYKLQATLKKLPPDVVDEGFTKDYLANVLGRSRKAVKLVILDQQKIGGMGNIYANDALHLAKIHPNKPANQLNRREIGRLHEAMVAVINKGIETGGASYSNYVQIDGMGGSYQKHFVVYDKAGEKCPRPGCRGLIEKMKLGGRGTYYCPLCQDG